MLIPTHPKDGAGDAGGTKQGRITAKSAAQPQTWPPLIKKCIRSRFPNGRLLWKDLSQIEPRIAALKSGDASMIRVFTGGGDYHDDTTIQLFGKDIVNHPHYRTGDMRVDPRQWGKTGGLLILYRGGWEKMQHTILADSGILLPDDLCQRVVKAMPTIRPGLWEWQEQTIRLARRDGYLIEPFTGQSRYFMNQGRKSEDWDVNEIVNFPIQTCAGNVLLQIQIAVARRLPSLNSLEPHLLMCHQVYDSILFDCATEFDVGEAKRILAEAVEEVATVGYWHMLEEHYGRHVPLKYDMKEITFDPIH